MHMYIYIHIHIYIYICIHIIQCFEHNGGLEDDCTDIVMIKKIMFYQYDHLARTNKIFSARNRLEPAQ